MILCVLRSGGAFRPEHVERLADQVDRYTPAGTHFVCLTDQVDEVEDLGVEAVSLPVSWQGWFAKLCAFRLLGPVLMLDLDVSVIGDLTPLLREVGRHDLIMARGFWGNSDVLQVNSSIVGWRGDVSHIYNAFAADPERMARTYSVAARWGDQAVIRDFCQMPIMLWQDLCPGMVASFKRGALLGEDLSNCRVLCSHGLPRPWDRRGADEWLKGKRINA